MRGTWVYRDGKLVEKGGPLDVRSVTARADMPCPMLISDSMTAAEHVDGNFYESKSAFRAVTKAQGLVEVGNDPSRLRYRAKPDREKGIDQAIDRAIARAS